jgi:hypothetical protein
MPNFVGKHKGNISLGRPKCGEEDNIKIDLKNYCARM